MFSLRRMGYDPKQSATPSQRGRSENEVERLPEFIANNLFLVMLFISLLTLLLWNLFGAVSSLGQVQPAEATRLVNHEKAILVDVRAAAEFEAGHIINALHIPGAELEGRKDELSKGKNAPVIVYCNRGTDSGKAGRALKRAGHEQVYVLKGGLESWRGANLPVTRG